MTLPGTLLCPGTEIDNTFKLKKFQPINERTSQASLITSSPIGDGTEETVPERNRSVADSMGLSSGVAVERRIRDREVAGSSLGRALRRKNSGQVSHTYG